MIIDQLKQIIKFLVILNGIFFVNNGFTNPLESWESWILKDYPKYECPWVLTNDNSKTCIWPGKLVLGINDSGGTFTYYVEVYEKKSFVPLPGSSDHWPDDLTINEKPVSLIDRAGIPYVVLNQGSHRVTGRFNWKASPRRLRVPKSIAIVSLSINGKNHLVDRRNEQLIFTNNIDERAKKNSDSLTIEVFRLVQDGVPVRVSTQLRLSVSGKAREVTFGQVMLEGTEVLDIRSQIPARIEADGTMRAQVTPGEHTLEVVARFTVLPSTIKIKKLTDEWPESEYISFLSSPLIRQAKLSGAESVDTSQINIPPGWSQFPTYRLDSEKMLNIDTEIRGDYAPAANELKLQRDLWLDFDGSGLTAFDRINGEMNKDWRLNVVSGIALGRAMVDGEPILITRDEGRQGIEIRSPAIQLEAITRTESNTDFSASGWDAKVDQYNAKLHLPPGWRVLHASGVDRVRGTWLSQWDLWNVFLLLIIVSVTRKLMGSKVALLSAATFFLALHEPGTPLMVIPVLLVIIALLPIVSGKIKGWLRNLGMVFTAILVFLVIGFAVERFRLAIYPSLERAQIGTYHQGEFSPRKLQSAPVPTQLMEPEAAMKAEVMMEVDNLSRKRGVQEDPVRKNKNLYQVTENDRVQTGPGLPTWTWNSVTFRSSGPISSDQSLSIYYSKPLATSLWLVLSVLLVFMYAALIIARFIQLCDFSSNTGNKGHGDKTSVASAVSIVIAMLIVLPQSQNVVAQEFPPKYLMDRLEQRLIKAPSCLPSCVSLNNGLIKLEGSNLYIELNAYSDTDVALPLPNGYDSWSLISLESDNDLMPLRKEGGDIFAALTKGQHTLILKGKIHGDQASIRFPIPIHNLSVSTQSWIVEGLVDGRVTKDVLTLRTREQSTTLQKDTLKADPPSTFARVIRHFNFGKRWIVNTTVIRETTEGAVSLPIKLLTNERLLSEVGVVDGDELTIQFEHRQHRIDWLSSLEPTQELLLKASSGSAYFEQWSFTPSSLWRIEYEGIPPLKPKANANAFEPSFKPWPGETLKVVIRKPEGVPGPVNTVESALLTVEAGKTLQRSTMKLNIRASIGTDYPVNLPENAEVLKFTIDGRVMNTPADSKVIVPLQPRDQEVTIEFQTPVGVGLVSHSPKVYLPSKATNIKLEYQLPRDRWPLYLSGPAIGPAMLYWGVLVVIILGALGLPYLAKVAKLNVPVSTLGWLLLGLGLSTVNSYGVIVIATMFFILAARKDYVNPQSIPRFRFNTMQVGIVLWVLFALLCMLVAIPAGLLSNPEMKVIGNGSSSHFYKYYQDMVGIDHGLPTTTIISVPLIAYRIVMLLWSLWLSTRLIQWATWAWECYKEKGVWLSKVEPDKIAKVKETSQEKTVKEDQ